MLVRVMHISNEQTDRRGLLRRLAQFCDLIPGEVRMLVEDDLISENIDLADCDDSFAYVKRIALPAFYARQNKLIQELARVWHGRTPQSAAFSARLNSKLGSLAIFAAIRCASSSVRDLANK
jgi:hypothetical protein